MNRTALHLHLRGTGHRTGRGTEVPLLDGRFSVCLRIRIFNHILKVAIIVEVILVLTDTRTGTIDITTIQPLNRIEVITGIDTAYLTTVDRHTGVATHMTVLTTAIDRAKDTRTVRTACSTNSHFRLIDITREERRTVEITRGLSDVRSRLTTATAEDITVRQSVLHIVIRFRIVNIAHGTTSNLNCGFTAAQEGFTKVARVIPQVICNRFTISRGRVVIRTAGVVTLTDRTHVTATIDITHHITTRHLDIGITKHLTSRDTVNGSIIFVCRLCRSRRRCLGSIVCYCSYLLDLFKLCRKGSLTLTSAVDGMTDQTATDRQSGITHDVTILSTAVYRTCDTITAVFLIGLRIRSAGISYINLSRTDIGTIDIVLIVAGNTLTAAIDITIVLPQVFLLSICQCMAIHHIRTHIVLTRDAETSACNVDVRCTIKTGYILEMVRPTQGKAISLVSVLMEVDIFSAIINSTVNDTHRGHLTATIDALLHLTTADVDIGILTHATGKDHWRELVTYIFVTRAFWFLDSNQCLGVIVFTSVTATIDILVHRTAGNRHGSIVTNGTQLATAIDITLDGTTADVDLRELHLSHLRPDRINITIKKIQTSHRAAEDITRLGISDIITNGTATDFNGDMAVSLTVSIFHEVTIVRIFRSRE